MESLLGNLMKSKKIFGMAWNWKGGKNVKDFPVIFQKPVSAVIQSGNAVRILENETVVHESN